MLVKESNCESSPPPLSTNKSTKLDSVVSVVTVVPCNGVLASLNIAVSTGGS